MPAPELELIRLQRAVLGETGGLVNAVSMIFLIIGPLKTVPLFHQLSANLDYKRKRHIALYGFLVSTFVVLVIAWLGEGILRDFEIPLTALALSGGIILCVNSAREMFGSQATDQESWPIGKSDFNIATNELTFAVILPPYSIAIVLLFLILTTRIDSSPNLLLLAVVSTLMVNLVGMLASPYLLRIIRPGVFKLIDKIFLVLIFSLGLSYIISSIQIEALTINLLLTGG
jgi:multiple antibiotic resistance protein